MNSKQGDCFSETAPRLPLLSATIAHLFMLMRLNAWKSGAVFIDQARVSPQSTELLRQNNNNNLPNWNAGLKQIGWQPKGERGYNGCGGPGLQAPFPQSCGA